MKRWCLMALGWLAFATGIVGIVLPLLPTTPSCCWLPLCLPAHRPVFIAGY